MSYLLGMIYVSGTFYMVVPSVVADISPPCAALQLHLRLDHL